MREMMSLYTEIMVAVLKKRFIIFVVLKKL